MTLNEEGNEFANRWQIEQLVKKYSDHIAYPIFLSYDQTTYDDKEKDSDGNALKKTEHKVEQINSSSALWRRPKNELTDEQYNEFYKQSSYDSEDPLFYLHTRAEGATSTSPFLSPPRRRSTCTMPTTAPG